MAPVRAPLVIEFHGSSFPLILTMLQSIMENRPPQTAKLPVSASGERTEPAQRKQMIQPYCSHVTNNITKWWLRTMATWVRSQLPPSCGALVLTAARLPLSRWFTPYRKDRRKEWSLTARTCHGHHLFLSTTMRSLQKLHFYSSFSSYHICGIPVSCRNEVQPSNITLNHFLWVCWELNWMRTARSNTALFLHTLKLCFSCKHLEVWTDLLHEFQGKKKNVVKHTILCVWSVCRTWLVLEKVMNFIHKMYLELMAY